MSALRDDCATTARRLRWALACNAAGFAAAAVIIPFDGGDFLASFGFAFAALSALAAYFFVGMSETWRALALDAIKRHGEFVDNVIRAAKEDQP